MVRDTPWHGKSADHKGGGLLGTMIGGHAAVEYSRSDTLVERDALRCVPSGDRRPHKTGSAPARRSSTLIAES